MDGLQVSNFLVEQFARNMEIDFFNMIERADINNTTDILKISNLHSVDFHDVLYIKKQESLGNLNHKLSSMLFSDYEKTLETSGEIICFQDFISDYKLFLCRYIKAIELIKLGAYRETINILTGVSIEKIKLLRKKLDLATVAGLKNQNQEDAHNLFEYIEMNSIKYIGQFNEDGTKEELVNVLIEISLDFHADGIMPPFSHLWKTLLYHFNNGSMVNSRTNSKYYCSVLIERINAEYESRGKDLEQKRLLSAR